MHQRHWRENKTRRSQGGLTLTCDDHWKTHKFEDDDGQTQTSVSWAWRPPFCFFFFLHTLLLHSFWTSRGHTSRPFFASVLAFNFYRIEFSNPYTVPNWDCEMKHIVSIITRGMISKHLSPYLLFGTIDVGRHFTKPFVSYMRHR